ncbi:inositol monophosphatase family protein [Dactylosporangium sp. NPDC005555]|uniref:inositol monophosphatase family protein n=1 Tax=Dactylosporangium sp. NPDC005555 TaxID=3154889 RepID=UPI0033AE24C0
MSDLAGDLALARRAALAGAEVGLRYFAALAELPRELKADGSVVTEADRAVEAAVRAVLGGARPDDAILGEEGGLTGTGGRRWIIDPIDGTAMFVAGDDRWLVLVALEEDGEVVAGVAVVPAQGTVWWAARGAGAYQSGIGDDEGRRLRVDPTGADTPHGATVGVIPDDYVHRPDRAMLEPLTAVARTAPWPVHAALLVADGRLDLAVQTRGQIWDFAATSLIVREAGGRYSGLDGRQAPDAGPSLFSRSAALHGATLKLLDGS